jgi:hypothetical protein
MHMTLTGEADLLKDRLLIGPVKALEGLRYEPYIGADGLQRWRITAGEPTWEGMPREVCQEYVDTFGLTAFLVECQHEISAGGRLFSQFEETRDGKPWHVCDPFPVPAHWTIWGSHDYGTGAPCASYVYAADEQGDVYVIGEQYAAGLTSSQQAEGFQALLRSCGVEQSRINLIAFDHAGTFPPENPKERIGEYPVEVWWRKSLRAVQAVKDRKAGWRNGQEWLASVREVSGVRKPRFQIFRGAASNLVKFLNTAPQDPIDRDELDRTFREDHAGDSWRYGLMVRPLASPPLREDAGEFAVPTWLKRARNQKDMKL